MATLTVWKFDTEAAAGALEELSREQDPAIGDAATVVWGAGERSPRTRHLDRPGKDDALGGDFWGLLFGLIFFVPLLGAAMGTATGAFSGSLSDVGIDDAFINRVRDQVTPGTSALFLMSTAPTGDAGGAALAGHAAREVFFTDLDPEQEQALREVFAD